MNDPDSEVHATSQQEQQLRAVMLQKDPLLVRILLGGALGALPKSRVDDIAAVFYDMLYVSSSSTNGNLLVIRKRLLNRAS